MMTSSAVSKKYDIVAPFYDAWFWLYNRRTIAAAIDAANLVGEETICDIGCGTGVLEKNLLARFPGLTIAACDLSVGMIARALKKLHERPQVTFYTGDFTNIPLRPASCDTLFALSNFHYFPDPAAILRKAATFAKPHGKLVLVDWEGGTMRGRFYERFMRSVDRGFQHIYRYTDVEQLLHQSGWKCISHTSFTVQGYWTMMTVVAKRT